MRKRGGEPYLCYFILTTYILSPSFSCVCIQIDQIFSQHLFTDLRPYVCTFEQCDLKLFPDRHTWFEHELECHRLEWYCPLCSHQPFTSELDFKSHMFAGHAHLLTSSQISALLQVSKQPVDRIPAAACVFCDWETFLRNSKSSNPTDETLVVTVEEFRHHLGTHMETLALSTIPRDYKEKGESADKNEAARYAQYASPHPLLLKQRGIMSPLFSQSRRQYSHRWSSSTLDCRLWAKMPFPRSLAAVPQCCSGKRDLYFHGGLIDGYTGSGDFGIIEMKKTPAVSCYPIAMSSEGPRARFGAAALNAEKLFFLFGGDTRLKKGDNLDTALYAFNTSEIPWLV